MSPKSRQHALNHWEQREASDAIPGFSREFSMPFDTLFKMQKTKEGNLPLFHFCYFFHYGFDPLDGLLFAAVISLSNKCM
jgi:hypothetical protein